jgi:hypothetical protein
MSQIASGLYSSADIGMGEAYAQDSPESQDPETLQSSQKSRSLSLALANCGHCAPGSLMPSQIDVIEFLDAAGNKVKTYAAPFRIKSGDDIAFSLEGNILKISAAVAAGPSGPTGPIGPTGPSGPAATDHAVLTDLDYAHAGHTGFSPDTHTHSKGYVGQTPADFLTGMKFWLDGDYATVDGSGKVSSWTDLSGNGYHFTQATAANQPTQTLNALNGHGVITFNGSSTWLGNTVMNLFGGTAKPFCLIFIAQATAQGSRVFHANDGAANIFEVGPISSGWDLIMYGAGATVSRNYTYAYTDASRFCLFCIYTDKASGALLVNVRESGRVLSKDLDLNISSVYNMTNNCIGARPYAVGQFPWFSSYFNGQIASILGFSTLPTESELDSLERYYINRYGFSSYTCRTATPANPIGNSITVGNNTLAQDTDHVMNMHCASANVTYTLPLLTSLTVYKTLEFARQTTANAFYARIATAGTNKIRGIINGITFDAVSFDLVEQYQSITLRGVVDNTGAFYWEIIGMNAPSNAQLGAQIAAATEKTTPVDADTFPLADSAATPASLLSRITWANIKTKLKTYFDPIYGALVNVRTKLTANTDYYVRTDGNDANDGSANDAAHAWATPQRAIDYIRKYVDPAGYNIQVHVADGDYSTADSVIKIYGEFPNIGQFKFTGNTTTPANVIWGSNIDAIKVFGWASTWNESWPGPGQLHFEGMKLTSTTRCGIYAETSWVTFGKIDFGACAITHIRSVRGSCVQPMDDYTISGDAFAHFNCEYYGIIISDSKAVTVTLSGTRAFTAFAYIINSGAFRFSTNLTFSGSATGLKFAVSTYGIIDSNGQGEAVLPGNALGTKTSGGVYDWVGLVARDMLSANRTYYVRTDGNDSNNGLVNTAAGAFLTIQAAVTAYQALDCNGYDVTIQVGDGTYTGATVITNRIGAGNLYLLGNVTTPANVLLNVTGICISINGHPSGSKVYLRGFKLQGTTHGILVDNGSVVYYGNVNFGACGTYHIVAVRAGKAFFDQNYTISAGAGAHLATDRMGLISVSVAITVTLSGTPNFSTAFAYATMGGVLFEGGYMTFSGSGTGVYYSASLNAVINTNGAGATHFPGNSAGGVVTGGQYA